MIKAIGGFISSLRQGKEKSFNHIAAAIRILERKPEDPSQYRWARKVAESYQLEKSHPLHQLILGTQSKRRCDETIQPFSSVSKTEVQISQNRMAPEEFISYIRAYGEQYISIEITEASDDLFEAIAQNCPNLSTLIFNESAASPSFDLSDEGLFKLSQLANITHFEFNCFSLINVSVQGMEALLQNKKFASNLVCLKLQFPSFNDSCYRLVTELCLKLETLSIQCDLLSHKILYAYPIPKSVKSFTLSVKSHPEILITDVFLCLLPLELKKLSIEGSFKEVSESGFKNAMKKLPNLDDLTIASTIIHPYVLSILQPLKRLRLGDCSLLKTDQFAEFFKFQVDLTDLTMENAPDFDSRFAFPETLTRLYLHAPKLSTLAAIPSSLQELTIDGMDIVSFDLGFYISRLKSLHTLQVFNCSWFNRDSLEIVMNAIGDNISKIALIGTTVDDVSLIMLAHFSRLTSVALGNLKATTKEGIQRFLADDRVAARTRYLYFFDLLVTNEMSSSFTKFENLKVLYIGNSLIGYPGPQDIFINPTLLANGTEFSDWYGPNLYSKFLSEVK